VPCRARDVRRLLLRRRASRPQLKRDPLGRDGPFGGNLLPNWQLQLARYGVAGGCLIVSVGTLMPSGGPLRPMLWAVGFLSAGVASAMRAVNWHGVTDRIVANSDHFWGLSRDRELALQRSMGRIGAAVALAAFALAAVLVAIHPRR